MARLLLGAWPSIAARLVAGGGGSVRGQARPHSMEFPSIASKIWEILNNLEGAFHYEVAIGFRSALQALEESFRNARGAEQLNQEGGRGR